MPLTELDDFFGDQGEMSHVTQSHVVLCLCLIASLLAVDDSFRDPPGFEKIDGQRAVVTPVHRTIENLLYNIVYYIVKKVIPREAEEEILEAESVSYSHLTCQ